MTEKKEEQMSIFDQDIWFGKTFQEHSVPMAGKTSELSLKKRQESQTKMPLFLDLRKDRNGLLQDAFWEMGGPLPGEFTMRSFGECPSAENVSRLSQILEEKPHPKYSLSAKACQGILNRASRRGKKLPPQLEEALIRQATPLKSDGGREIDSKGHKAGKGALVQTELSGTLGVSQDQTLIQTTSDGSEVAGTLDASYYKGCGLRQGRERTVVYGISAYDSNSMKSANPNSGIYEAETSRTFDLNGGSPACNQGGMAIVSIENHPADGRVKISEDGTMQALTSRMGTGEGNVPMVMEPVCIGNGQAHIANHLTEGVSQTLNCMHDPMAVMTYGLDRAAYNQGQNVKFDFSVEEEKIGAQVARGPGAVCQSVVRRLTPLECERLQGFPDGWTDIGDWIDSKGKLHKGDSDSPRYKALGNSIALPFWEWMAKRMAVYLPQGATMASLFDGIGGFPLVFSRAGIKPVWASEIEEFPIAVTKKHFKEEI